MNTVRSADGTKIAFTKAGQGPPLILVDGALCSRSFGPMPKLAAQLTAHFTVYTYDRRGRGASGDTPPYAAGHEVDDLEALVELARGDDSPYPPRRGMAGAGQGAGDGAGETVFVHGTSSGAALALEAAKRIPAIGKLAVYEPPFVVDGTRSPIPDDYLARLNRLVADGRSGDAVKMFMRFVGTPAIFTAVMPLTPVWPKLKAVAPTLPYDITIIQDHQRGTPFTPTEWAAVKIPTLVAAGGKSPAWMTNATRALADALPDAQYRTLAGQNHMVKPQAIAPVLTEFFLAHD
jgi:pimeloyl-ACP methyl ester carboxylesterase